MSGGPFDDAHLPGENPSEPPANTPSFPPESTLPSPRPRPPATPARAHGRWDAWASLLNNRLILSGLAIVIVLLLIAIVLVSIGHGSDRTSPHTVLAKSTTSANSTALPIGDLSARVITTASLRSGPGVRYAILGTIPKGANVAAVGRNSDQSWVQILYPPGSGLMGWVDAQFLDVTGDVSQLAVASPNPTPVAEVPTESLPPTAVIIIEEATSTPAEETPATATSTPELNSTPTETPIETPTANPPEEPTPTE